MLQSTARALEYLCAFGICAALAVYEEALLVNTLPGYQAYMSRTSKLLPSIF